MQVFTQEARRDIGYYIMPHSLYPNGGLIEQVYSGDPELAAHLERLHLSPDTFNPAWIHANYRQGPACCRRGFPEHASVVNACTAVTNSTEALSCDALWVHLATVKTWHH